MAFIEYNANPYGKHIDDCIIRSITKATGKPYMDVMDGLIEVADSNGWECCELEGKWTVKQFSKQATEPRIVIVNNHATYVEDGNIYDTWNCSRYRIKRIFRKRKS